jgi:phage FluMu protein Com
VSAGALRRLCLLLSGGYSARCRECGHIFVARPFSLFHLVWAKCPRCFRLDLSTWDPEYYRSTTWMKIRQFLGANRWRCERCRVNFVSFRPRKLKYTRPGPPDTGVRDYEGARRVE